MRKISVLFFCSALLLTACTKSKEEPSTQHKKPELFKYHLNALEKAKKVEETINKAAHKRSLEVERQDQ